RCRGVGAGRRRGSTNRPEDLWRSLRRGRGTAEGRRSDRLQPAAFRSPNAKTPARGPGARRSARDVCRCLRPGRPLARRRSRGEGGGGEKGRREAQGGEEGEWAHASRTARALSALHYSFVISISIELSSAL